jgi:surface polysaccharide O-acyltransferase-like enzyme
LEKAGGDSSNRINLPDDLIRTLSIFLVILLHASNEILQAPSVPPGYWWTAVAYKSVSLVCVPLFVMLSGALLLQPGKLNEPIRIFLKKRLSRIGLAFVFWSAIYLAWGFFLTSTPVTFGNIGKGILYDLFSGAYYQFWFIYLIVGLYLITPILRVIIAYGSDRILRYLLLLWFVGIAVVPILQLASGLTLNPTVFVIGGWIGYYVLGTYLQRKKVRSSFLFGLLIAGFATTIFGVWLMTYPLTAVGQNNFFFDYLTANVILGSAALFMILMKFPVDWPGSNHKVVSRIVGAISVNTLPLFLFHVIILQSLQLGFFFGFKLSFTTLNPIIEIPLIAVLTLFITLGLVLLMRKVPVLKKLIG